MAVGDITNEAILFHAELANADAEITAGPAANRRWKFILTVCNKSGADRTLTLYRRLAGPVDRHWAHTLTIKAGQTLIFGPYVLNTGQTVRGSASAASAIDVTADGSEEEV